MLEHVHFSLLRSNATDHYVSAMLVSQFMRAPRLVPHSFSFYKSIIFTSNIPKFRAMHKFVRLIDAIISNIQKFRAIHNFANIKTAKMPQHCNDTPVHS